MEYRFDVDASQLFPSKQVQKDVISAGHQRDYTIGKMDRDVMGFTLSATDVRIKVSPSKIDSASTRLDVDIQGKSVAIDSSLLHKKYATLQVDDIYGVYNAKTDKVTVHVPFATALSLFFR